MRHNPENDIDLTDDFDAEKAISAYRQVIAHLEAATTEQGKAELQSAAQRLRQEWRDCRGEDSLHEMAFGETAE